jgi:hypothetical protein
MFIYYSDELVFWRGSGSSVFKRMQRQSPCPSCYCARLMLNSRFKFIKIKLLFPWVPSDSQIMQHAADQKIKFPWPLSKTVHNTYSLWLNSPLRLDHLFSFLMLYAVGRTLWMGDQPVARPLPTHRKTQTE